MKKVIVTALLWAILSPVFSASAVDTDEVPLSEERNALIDTVVCKIVKCTFPIVAMVGELDDHEKLLIEYITFKVTRDVYGPALSGFTDSQLRALSRAYSASAGMYGIFEAMKKVVNDVIRFEAGQYPEFDYELNDKEYSALVDLLFDIGMAPDTFENAVRNMNSQVMQKAREAGADDEAVAAVQSVLNRIGSHLPNIIKLAYIECFDKNDLREIIDAFSCDELRDVLPVLIELEQMSDMSEERLYDDMAKYISSLDKKSFYEYLRISRSLPYPFILKSRPHMEMNIGRSMYSGQTRDLLPHGHGELVDKNGVVYKGDFKHGRRHGLIEVTEPDSGPVLQIWADDKYRKSLHVCKGEDGPAPVPGLYQDAYFGYGRTYDAGTQTMSEGYFVDGELHGTGVLETPSYTCSGVFEDGLFREGAITWKSEDWMINEFRGVCSGSARKGIHHRVSSDGSKDELLEGLFINGSLDGQALYVIKTPSDTSVMKGSFALGKMFGEGVIRYSRAPDGHGIKEVSVYEGGLASDLASGMGRCTITLTDVPDGNWWFRRFGVKVSDVAGGTDVVIRMTGCFEDGYLKEGRVEVSDGDVMSGVFEDDVLKQGYIEKYFSDGTRYVGECRNGMFDGEGVLTYSDGDAFVGTFAAGQPSVGELRDSNGKVIRRYDKMAMSVNK